MSDAIRTFKHFVRVIGQLDPDADRFGIYINYDKRFVATPLFFREFVTGDHRAWLCLRLHRVVVEMNAAVLACLHDCGGFPFNILTVAKEQRMGVVHAPNHGQFPSIMCLERRQCQPDSGIYTLNAGQASLNKHIQDGICPF